MKKGLLSQFILLISYYCIGQNVGVGTTSPQSKLHISSTTSEVLRLNAPSQPFLSLYQNGVYSGYFWNSPNSIEIGSAATSNLPITLAPDGIQRLVVTPQGNVGIGTLNPSVPLGFSNATGKKITLFTSATGDAGFGTGTNALLLYADNINADILFGYDQPGGFAENMRLKGNGNLGLGTTNPTEKLEIQGNVKAQAFKYPSPKTFYYSIPPPAFNATYSASNISLSSVSACFTTTTATGGLLAPVLLPEGAVITSMKVYFKDNSGLFDLNVLLTVKQHNEDSPYPSYYGTMTSSGIPGNSNLISDPLNITVNNQLYDYSVLAHTGPNWPGPDIQVLSVVLTYTMTEAL